MAVDIFTPKQEKPKPKKPEKIDRPLDQPAIGNFDIDLDNSQGIEKRASKVVDDSGLKKEYLDEIDNWERLYVINNYFELKDTEGQPNPLQEGINQMKILLSPENMNESDWDNFEQARKDFLDTLPEFEKEHHKKKLEDIQSYTPPMVARQQTPEGTWVKSHEFNPVDVDFKTDLSELTYDNISDAIKHLDGQIQVTDELIKKTPSKWRFWKKRDEAGIAKMHAQKESLLNLRELLVKEQQLRVKTEKGKQTEKNVTTYTEQYKRDRAKNAELQQRILEEEEKTTEALKKHKKIVEEETRRIKKHTADTLLAADAMHGRTKEMLRLFADMQAEEDRKLQETIREAKNSAWYKKVIRHKVHKAVRTALAGLSFLGAMAIGSKAADGEKPESNVPTYTVRAEEPKAYVETEESKTYEVIENTTGKAPKTKKFKKPQTDTSPIPAREFKNNDRIDDGFPLRVSKTQTDIGENIVMEDEHVTVTKDDGGQLEERDTGSKVPPQMGGNTRKRTVTPATEGQRKQAEKEIEQALQSGATVTTKFGRKGKTVTVKSAEAPVYRASGETKTTASRQNSQEQNMANDAFSEVLDTLDGKNQTNRPEASATNTKKDNPKAVAPPQKPKPSVTKSSKPAPKTPSLDKNKESDNPITRYKDQKKDDSGKTTYEALGERALQVQTFMSIAKDPKTLGPDRIKALRQALEISGKPVRVDDIGGERGNNRTFILEEDGTISYGQNPNLEKKTLKDGDELGKVVSGKQ